MAQKYNKGEWAEFYAFIDILAKGKLYAADENTNKIPDRYYHILSAIKNDIEYIRDEDNSNITFEYGNDSIEIPISSFNNILDEVFKSIKNGKFTFEIAIAEPLIEKLKIKSIKEGSQTKGDIRIRIHDDLVGHHPIHSFSIKSYVGGAPTLLNASNGTIFTYAIEPPLSPDDVLEINNLKGNRGWLDQIIEEIHTKNSSLVFFDLSSPVFKTNLEMIDFRMPEILADVLVEGYLVDNKIIKTSVESYVNKNPEEKERIITYKIKELLTASALGMVPMSEWEGLDEANGGYIIVKDNSEVLCYHLYERNKLKEYLYNNTRFETPSTSRYGAGQIYTENGDQFIKLGLQIRF